jgi:methylated-DNA-[protein]-cysteine S-methyltransferase
METTMTTTERGLDVESPFGALRVVASDRAVSGIYLRRDPRGAVEILARAPRGSVLAQAERELAEYFAGRRTEFSLRLAPRGTDFQRAVWKALERIPFGATRSYADIARAVGRPEAVRAVGAANGRNPISIVVPCHRVIGSDGSLTGYAGGLPMKRWLLEHERG